MTKHRNPCKAGKAKAYKNCKPAKAKSSKQREAAIDRKERDEAFQPDPLASMRGGYR